MTFRQFLAACAALILLPVADEANAKADNAPIPKIEKREPIFDRVSSVDIYDIERCFIRLDVGIYEAVPIVYSQPDRPNERMLVWPGAGSGVYGRADLKVVETGTHAKLWLIEKRDNVEGFEACAPPAPDAPE